MSKVITVRLADVNIGQVFSYKGEVYCKEFSVIPYGGDKTPKQNAVSVHTDKPVWIPQTEEVRVVCND